jgi:hypothetical protein
MRHNLNKVDGEYSLTSAQRVGGRRKPRTRTIALTDCVCYDRDGNEINRISRTSPLTPRKRTAAQAYSKVEPTRYDSRRDIILAATMGSLHLGDN